MQEQISHQRLLSVLAYCPETGHFTWRVSKGPRPAGTRAGSKNKQSGHIEIGVDGVTYRAHRLAWFYMLGVWPQPEVDHRDGEPANNKWPNLREASRLDNTANVKVHRDNAAALKGVSFHGQTGKWRARIMRAGRRYALGLFDTPAAAHAAFCAAATKLHGDFARFQ